MIYGHEDKEELFKRLIIENQLNHAYLFFGPPQIGKNKFAESLAHLLEYGEFCVKDRPLFDAMLLSPNKEKDAEESEEKSNSQIGIKEARIAKNFLYKCPLKSKKRLVIIDQAETLTMQAESALLKIVEEPGTHSMIIFITHNVNAIFPTLSSRLTRIYFSNIRTSKVIEILIKDFSIAREKAEGIAKKSFGRIGKAIAMIQESDSKKIIKEENLENSIEKNIIDLYLNSPIKNSSAIYKLLEKEEMIKRFNLNQKLQKKAISYIM